MHRFRVLSGLLLLSSVVFAQRVPSYAIIFKPGGAVGFYSSQGELLQQVKVGSFPHEAALSPDGKYLYVSDNGVLWMTEDKLGTNTISVLDVHAMKRVATIDLGRFHRPHGIAFIPGTQRLLATTERPYGLIMVDTVARKVVRDYDVKGKSPHMVMPTPNGKAAYASNTDSANIAYIDLETGNTKVIPTGQRPQGGVFSPDGKRFYVTNGGSDRIAILDASTQETIGAIATGKGPGRIAITPDGRTLVYNMQQGQAVGFADVASSKQIASIPLGGNPLSLTMTRDGKMAFSGVQDNDKVFFISVPDRKIVRVIETPKGSGPDPVIPLR